MHVLSSSLRPQLAIETARSQSPLCGATAAQNPAFCDGSTKESLISAQSFWTPNLSKKDCLLGNGAGSGNGPVFSASEVTTLRRYTNLFIIIIIIIISMTDKILFKNESGTIVHINIKKYKIKL